MMQSTQSLSQVVQSITQKEPANVESAILVNEDTLLVTERKAYKGGWKSFFKAYWPSLMFELGKYGYIELTEDPNEEQ